MAKCQDAECHEEKSRIAEKAKEAWEYLFNKGGIRDKVSDFITKDNLRDSTRWIVGLILIALLACAGSFFNTYVQGQQVPEIKDAVKQNTQEIADTKTKVAVLESELKGIKSDTQQIIDLLSKQNDPTPELEKKK